MVNNDWKSLIKIALLNYNTPFYLFSFKLIEDQLKTIYQICDNHIHNCLSFKTLPLKELLKWWHNNRLMVEVTTEYELLACQKEGFESENIIVNGVSKHSWNKKCWTDELRINFDSLNEILYLVKLAQQKKWHIGLRYHPSVQNDPENSSYPDQFGLSSLDMSRAVEILKSKDLNIETIHIHLRSNIPSLSTAIQAIDELQESLSELSISIKSIDLGGGLPATNIVHKDSAWDSNYTLKDLKYIIDYVRKKFNTVEEIYLENGRYILSKCGILVFSIVDIKNINGHNFIMCDGGRTNNALPSDWEDHQIGLFPSRMGELVPFNLCGPTCMAYDCFARIKLPNDTQLGDKIIYYDAGAYHISWENRFSHPLARILWYDHTNKKISEVRKKESFNNWWKNK